MAEQPVTVQKISWSDLCPWTIILRTLPAASSFTVLAFALLGVVLMPLGWLLSETLFINQELRDQPLLMEIVELNRSPYQGIYLAPARGNSINVLGTELSGPNAVFRQFVAPFEYVFSGNWGLREFLYFLVGSLWSLVVWSFIGVAIARVCLLRLTRSESIGMDEAFRFALGKWTTTMGALGIPLIAVAILCIPGFIVGLVMGFDFGVFIASIFWFIVLAFGIAIGILLLGLMFGWPLMVSSVACESQNSFDAMTRSYAYTFQRPINYVFYMLIAISFGGLCWLIVGTLANGIVDLTFWTTSWGANLVSQDRIDTIENSAMAAATNEAAILTSGRNIIGLWNALFKSLAVAFIYGLFWCMASSIYLLLRFDVDETEMDEIYIADETRTYELPPLQSDENGIPQVKQLVSQEEPATDEPGPTSNASE